ncbi:MAG TPA: hypothetical protein VHM91_24310 [Verrucomicrobiales bacterium]|jgi:hypothetical protein|nr:hypothetical protein [Verrucomicrobiales bacterium]
MTLRLLLSLLLLAAPFRVFGDAPPPADFAATVSAAKDVPAVAAILQEQLRRPLALIMEVKDADSLTKAKTALVEVTTNIDAIAKRLLQLPALSTAERTALSKKMAAADRAHLKAAQPALKAHLEAMPAGLKEEALKALGDFYKTVEDHKQVFELYLKPDGKPSKPEKTKC